MTDFIQGDVPPQFTDPTNRLRGLHVVYYDNVGYLEFPVEPIFELTVNDVIYTVQAGEEGRLDAIAFKAYGDASLWWFIASANDIFDPFSEMFAGMHLRIPPLSMLEA